MNRIEIAETQNSPSVEFDFVAHTYALRGMSFMEGVTSFYDPLMDPLRAQVSELRDATVRFDFALSYFNSSTARVVMMIFMLLDDVAGNGNDVEIVWHHEGDEDMVEQGEEFGEDLEHAKFTLVDDRAC